ncbi:RNA polymerase sigma-70 factor, ECF subfamily [Stigmatella aurantiaca]|uniref:RNA polymerase sigma-70 factor, ECF subfamily n=1 Tax=Stigmatella aurantiaca TaxID=41 RepID=A0A1H7LA86_STIAU|nr:sigma-70 family RNA polymerase sigma factor [Stigmatella aurantiaca]SEK95764.1 RNA polymerase sigma-70 factor, ECF subfamily [Stigmatella aurantiaca]
MSGLPLTELSIEELLRRVRAQEEGAWEELFRRSQDQLDAWAKQRVTNMLPGGARPSDVSQEAALRAFEQFSWFKGQTKEEWFAWLKRVLSSQWVDLIRQAQSQKRDDSNHLPLDTLEAQAQPTPQPSPSQVTAHQEQWRQLLAAFHQLSEDQGKALSLFYVKNLTMAEIAQSMGRSRDAVESLIHRGMRALKALMAGQTEPGPGENFEEARTVNAVDAALLVYFRRRDAGEDVALESFVAGYPDCSDELRSLLSWMEQLRALRPPDKA